MRVITGIVKGRKLESFTGDKSIADGLRPTSDYLKGSMFSRIQFCIEGRNVLDLFAGTGQLGIEALSRGAAHADFVDTDISIVRKNLKMTGLSEKAGVFKNDSIAFLKGVKQRYDLIFLDPPYQSTLLDEVLQLITAIDILNIGGIIVCESSKESRELDGYTKDTRHYSGKVVTLYRHEVVE